MDTEINERLENIEKIVSDNNRMLTKLRSAQKNAIYWRIVYWIVILGLAIASFYAIQPYVSQFGAAYGIGSSSANATVDKGQNTTATLLNLVKQYQADQKK